MSNTAYHKRQRANVNALMSYGVVVQMEPQDFLEIVNRSQDSLVLESMGGFFKIHYRYLTSYKGLTFFTKSYEEPLTLPQSTEVIKVKCLNIPREDGSYY